DHHLVEGLVGYPQRFPLGAFLETDRPDFISVVRHLSLQLRMPRRQSKNDLAKGAGEKAPSKVKGNFRRFPHPSTMKSPASVSARTGTAVAPRCLSPNPEKTSAGHHHLNVPPTPTRPPPRAGRRRARSTCNRRTWRDP